MWQGRRRAVASAMLALAAAIFDCGSATAVSATTAKPSYEGTPPTALAGRGAAASLRYRRPSRLPAYRQLLGDRAQAASAKPDCPPGLNCRFVPAAYAGTSSSDLTVYGNYDPESRPSTMRIKYIIIH